MTPCAVIRYWASMTRALWWGWTEGRHLVRWPQ